MVPTQERKIHPGALRKLAEESLGGQVDWEEKKAERLMTSIQVRPIKTHKRYLLWV